MQQPWRLRFFSIWVGQSVSFLGTALTQFVLMWWISDTTGSVEALSWAGVAALLPVALFSPLAGLLADRWDRRWIMIVSDLVSALGMVFLLVLFYQGTVSLPWVYAAMALRSTMQAFQQPASAASTVLLVPSEKLTMVAGWNQSVQGLATVGAAPLGALAIALFSYQGALFIDVVTAFLGIVPLLMFRLPPVPRTVAPSHHWWKDMAGGVVTTVRTPGLLTLFLLLGLVVLCVMPSVTLTPLLVKTLFQGGVNEVAWMESFVGIGMMVGGLVLSFWSGFRNRTHSLLFFFALCCSTVALVGLLPQTGWIFAVALWFVNGLTYALGNAPLAVILQTKVAPELQGRLFALLNLVMGLAAPLGLALASFLSAGLAVGELFLLMGVSSTAVLVLALFSKDLRRLGRREQEGIGG